MITTLQNTLESTKPKAKGNSQKEPEYFVRVTILMDRPKFQEGSGKIEMAMNPRNFS